MIKTLYWYQLFKNLGPLAISVKKILYDLLLIILVYGVIFTAFAASIGLIMNEGQKSESLDGQKNQTNVTAYLEEKNEEEEAYNAFRYWVADYTTKQTMDGVFKTMFWILFDPGKPEYLGTSRY